MTTPISTLAARVRDLEAKATKAPWFCQIQTSIDAKPNDPEHCCGLWTDPRGGPNNLVVFSWETSSSDFMLMALLRNAAPVFAAAMEELETWRAGRDYKPWGKPVDQVSAESTAMIEAQTQARAATDAALAAFEAGQGKGGGDAK